MNAAALSIDALIQHELPAAREGDQGAYGRIVAACQNTVTAVALAITRDVSASEDIAQEAFFNAWQHLERLHNPDSFLPWLRQITRNLARDHLRAHRNQPLDGPNAELVMAMAADPGPHPMQKLLEDERESTAFELISSLPDDSREALLLFYREGQSSQQVAMLLGISDAAARKRLSRARQLVRDDILKRFGEFARSSAPSAAFTAAVITTLGIASKPAAAAGATAIGTATLGGSLAGKGLAGALGMGSVIGGSLLGGAIAAHLTRRYLLVFADTLEERDAILRDYNLYLYVTLTVMLAAFLVLWWVPSFAWAMTATIAAEGASLWTLLRIRARLRPMMARDAARDPRGAKARYRAYDYSYGPTAIVVSGLFYLLSMAIFYLGLHYGIEGSARAIGMMFERFPGMSAYAAIDALIGAELPAARGGDRAAYGRIVAACQNTITAVALAITHDVPASEDIAQEAFLSAWQHLKRLQNPSSFLPWLRQITRNLARDHLRAQRHRPLDGAGADIAIELAADPSPTPMQRLVEDEREHAAAELISALPEDSREVLLLFYREGQSSRQVALLLGLSDAAVRKRLSRARQSVREDLLARFGEFAAGSAPGVAFTGIVATALTFASPPAAAKGILGIAAAGGAKTLGKVALGAGGSLAIGLIGAFAGIWLGLRRQLKGAIDEEERQGLIRSAAVNGAASVMFLVAMLALSRFSDGWVPIVLAMLVFMAVVFHQSIVVQPRILRRRHAMEAARDPVLAAKTRRRERIHCWLGAGVGIICGFGGVIAGLIGSGRL